MASRGPLAVARRRGGPERRAAARRPVVTLSVQRVALILPTGVLTRLARRVLTGEQRRSRAAARLSTLGLVFVGPAAMRRLNRTWKGHDRPTDVLSFSLTTPGGGRTGEVYICPAVARAQARELGVDEREELRRLVIHGILHVLGHDHPEGPGRTRSAMWRRQERYLAGLA